MNAKVPLNSGATQTMTDESNPVIAVLIPCFNEEATIEGVVKGFRRELPEAKVYVYDNNSSDRTVELAQLAGALLQNESRQGKGNVVRRMFADIEADIYILVDGDATYDSSYAPEMIRQLRARQLDMVVARRQSTDAEAYRLGHQLGNRVLTGAVGRIFGNVMQDILSGYRVFSRRFVKSFPAFSEGFQIETELTIHALELRLPVTEIDTPYYSRPGDSDSKLNTWQDGFRILATILRLFALQQPFRFFMIIAIFFFLAASILFAPILLEFLDTGLVLRIPTMIIVVTGYALSLFSFALGIILHTATIGRLESKRFAYLSVKPSPH